MRIGILGPLEVHHDSGRSITVPGPRPRALLTLLALNAERPVAVDTIIDMQYGPAAPDSAIGAIQAQVSRLRRVLGAGAIGHGPGGYRLAVDPDNVDAHRFTRLAGQGHRLLLAGSPAEAIRVLDDALALWRADTALPDLPGGHAAADRLTERRVTAVEDLVEARLAEGGPVPLARLDALAAAHPTRERLAGQRMRALAAAGRRSEALVVYDTLRRRLADDLGIDPSPELADLHRDLLRADRPAPPRRRTPAAPLTALVGREIELTRLESSRSRRLVTVTGPGGIGKTRLAVAEARRHELPACFVDLSGVVDDRQVPHTVLAAAGLREAGLRAADPVDPVDLLVTALRDEELLLVLDNCEHLVEAVAALTRTLLAECESLHVLATSREPLGLTGETVLTLGPLPVRGDGTEPGAAVRLFVDRATAARPGLALTDDELATVTGICVALDGLPLAIELAAARLRQFTVEQLAERLADHDRFRLLSRGDRTAAARHRTLEAAVAWSWDLLGPDERYLAARLSVFAGGGDLAAVERVTGRADTEELLADLVDKSLVHSDGDRYRMTETVRAYCAARLDETGQAEAVHRAHAEHHLALARHAEPLLRGPEQLTVLADLAAAHRDIVAALRWSVDHDRALGLRLLAALSGYWWLSGRRSEPGAVATALLTDVPDGLSEEYLAAVALAVPRAAQPHWDRGRRIMRDLGVPRHPFGVAMWGMVAGPADDEPRGRLDFGDDPWLRVLTEHSECLLWLLGGRPADADRGLAAVLDGFRAIGDRWGIAQALDWLAVSAGWRGEWAVAEQRWREALDHYGALGAADESVDVLVRRADARLRSGRVDDAATDYRAAAELATGAGHHPPPTIPHGLGELARLAGDHGRAAELLTEAFDATVDGGFAVAAVRGATLTALARIAVATMDMPAAAAHHRAAVALARRSYLVSELATVVEGCAEYALATGSAADAARLLGFGTALRGTTVAGDPDIARIAAAATGLLGGEGFARHYAAAAGATRHEATAAAEEILDRLLAD